QVRPDFARQRENPYLELPTDFFSIDNNNYSYLKPYDLLNSQQKFEVTQGPYRCLPVWPTQIFESISALIGCVLLYIHRKRGIRLQSIGETIPIFFRPGVTFALMFVIYGIMRFFIEFLRDDNPFQANGLTISQNLSIAMVLGGFLLIWLFGKTKPDKII
ncbi:MAG: prolipoprotein diacylglyceryl transferase, partial [bacterium]|nr:prolipoprotein diacylglyceryl transferase [bacterium]